MAHLSPGQNYDHLLDPISGYDGMHDLQFQGATGSSAEWHRGSLMGLNASGDIVPFADLGASEAPRAMGLWAINASYDFDVAGGGSWSGGDAALYRLDAGNIAGQTLASDNTTVQTRRIGTLVATGGFELVTTEFNQNVAYTYNDPLIGYTPVGIGSNPFEVANSYPEGWVTLGTIGTGPSGGGGNDIHTGGLNPIENVVGVVSSGEKVSTYGQAVLHFWPVYLPVRQGLDSALA